MTRISLRAKLYLSLTVAVGLSILAFGLLQWHSTDETRFLCYLLIASLTSGLKVTLPGITGTMSVNFLFILIGVVELSFPEALVMGCAGALVQCLWKPGSRIQPIQLLFGLGSMAITIAASSTAYHFLLGARLQLKLPLLLALSACVFFLINTVQIAAAMSLTERKPLRKVWMECYFWSFPYYLAGAAMAGLLSALNQFVGWQISVLVLPIVYWIYRSYRLYLGRLEAEKKHVEEMAGLHLRTIEALALAIEAKDSTTHAHLQRVRVYAEEIGKELGLPEPELEALRAAALLHDIGKLAVPEHIISKPGKLTPVEFEKMKIHPLVGAEILERVAFPYPVAPMVRAHHEKWDGSGYPSGLKGEEIPMGARILAAVDCLDALASDRQYRRALPLAQAMAHVVNEAGKSFDPRVVKVLHQRYLEIERLVQETPIERARLSTHVKIERGAHPAAGFEKADRNAVAFRGASALDFLSSIADARQEAQALFELTQNLGNSLSLDETLSVLSLRLKRLVPFDSIAVYVRRDNRLAPEYVSGENSRLFSSLEIPMGEGLSGWVAENRKPIVNGNPSVEPGYLNDPDKFSTLWSALTVPLEGVNGVVGVLSLYHAEKDFFSKDHLRILLAISDKAALSIENALKYRQAETCATTDALTGLPNARSLFLHLDRELARSKRLGIPLSVLVCDLDGFKQVNDRLGHLEGNKLLRAVAEGLQQTCREYDYVARMGGDEFVVVLPGHRGEAVRTKILTLMRMANEAGRRVCGEARLSMSVGGAFYPDDGNDAEQLLAEADRRMYKVKQKLAQSDHSEWEPETIPTIVQ
ncbi:MAG: diguanylate cyclase [Acidobacteria bacterium]|nr:diguanylate cyclase [Acidobacteriota bacterium]